MALCAEYLTAIHKELCTSKLSIYIHLPILLQNPFKFVSRESRAHLHTLVYSTTINLATKLSMYLFLFQNTIVNIIYRTVQVICVQWLIYAEGFHAFVYSCVNP
jgi:hypothetical protein